MYVCMYYYYVILNLADSVSPEYRWFCPEFPHNVPADSSKGHLLYTVAAEASVTAAATALHMTGGKTLCKSDIREETQNSTLLLQVYKSLVL